MSRRIVISGLGPISGLGIGIDANWAALCGGESGIRTIEAFNPTGFDCHIGSEVEAYKIGKIVPKSYRKATKVMARDIELAVIAADAAARDAGLRTPGTDASGAAGDAFEPTYAPERVGCHIGAGLIAADLDELTDALWVARDQTTGQFDMHRWGQEGMTHLTPLWLLKYLPNMLSCHVTIIHDARGPSNTITCAETSGGLSLTESMRVIQRGSADLCFCGGVESKLNPMTYLRQQFTDRLTSTGNDNPAQAVRPFDAQACGTAIGEGGGIVILEALDTFTQREGGQAYCEVLGFAATQTVNRAKRNREPDEQGKSIASAIRTALDESQLAPQAIDLIVPFGSGVASWDRAEVAAMTSVFGDRLATLPLLSTKAMVGNCGAGVGGFDLITAAKTLQTQTLPKIINRDTPLPGISGCDATCDKLEHVLVYSVGFGGQNVAIVLKRMDP